jgi:hypothetical protein
MINMTGCITQTLLYVTRVPVAISLGVFNYHKILI